MALHIPFEICETICQFVHNGHLEREERRSLMRTLYMLSHSFAKAAAPFLFDEVYIYSYDNKNLGRIVELAASKNAPTIRDIRFKLRPQLIFKGESGEDGAVESFLQVADESTYSNVVKILSSCSGLEHLEIDIPNRDLLGGEPYAWSIGFWALVLTRVPLPSVKHFSLNLPRNATFDLLYLSESVQADESGAKHARAFLDQLRSVRVQPYHWGKAWPAISTEDVLARLEEDPIRFLAHTAGLESLSIRGYRGNMALFSRPDVTASRALRHLGLRDFETTVRELAPVIDAHAASLEHVELHHLTLVGGQWQDVLSAVAACPRLADFACSRLTYASHTLLEGSSAIHHTPLARCAGGAKLITWWRGDDHALGDVVRTVIDTQKARAHEPALAAVAAAAAVTHPVSKELPHVYDVKTMHRPLSVAEYPCIMLLPLAQAMATQPPRWSELQSDSEWAVAGLKYE